MLLFAAFNVAAQQMPRRPNMVPADTLAIDSVRTDTTQTDSVPQKTLSGLTSQIEYTAEDSIRFSIDGNIIYLYGKGRISYEDFELDADYIRIDQKTKILFASGRNDKYSIYRGRPIFKQGSEAPVVTDSLIFNSETKKVKAFGTATSVDEGFIQAQQLKKNEYNEISMKNGIYSTCSLPEPYTHFGIHIDKAFVTEKQFLAKSAYLMIEHIPMPLWLPFGFFPKTNKRASGFRFPTFGEDANRGFYMQGIGWYLGINDYWDADITGTIYSKGSYDVNTIARYKKNYKYSGSLNFGYSSVKDPNAIEGTPEDRASKQFNVQWTHSQDQAANPGTTFSANVNFGTSSYYQQTAAGGTYEYGNIIRNNMSSSIAYGRTFLDGLFNFTTNLSHRQDLSTKQVDLVLPSFNLGMNTINPFDSKDRVGEQKWYQRITVGYTLQGQNTLSGQESQIFSNETVSNFKTGFEHRVPVSMSLNVLKVLQFNTSVNYNERWSFQSVRKFYDAESDSIITQTNQGFSRNYNYSLGGGLSTKVYGMVTFKKGNLVALRHVMTPTVNFSYSPDFTSTRYGFYRNIENFDQASDSIRALVNPRYSTFEGTVFGGPSGGRQAAIGFSLDNTIEAKVRSKSDTSSAFEKIPIIQGLNFSGSYNFAATEFKLSTINFSGRTAFFKQKIGLNFGGTFDPYQVEIVYGQARRINRLMIRDGKLARLTNFRVSTDFSFNSSALGERNKQLRDKQDDPNLTPAQQQDIKSILNNPNYYVDFSIPWNISASYSLNYNNNGVRSDVTNTLNFNGDFSVTPKWKVVFNSGYDFRAKEISLTQFSINRDLHCWDFAVRWNPFGMYKSYSVDIRVKSSILQDLKLSRRSALPLNRGF